MEQQIARIALSGVPYSADKLYSYLVPPELADACRAGVRVSVPFGRGNRRTEGFVLETLCEAADKPLKPVFTVLDEQPLLDASLLRLAKWMKARYFCTVYDALKTILPAGIWFRYRETYRLADGVQESDLSALAAANRTDKLLLETITARGEQSILFLNRRGNSRMLLCGECGEVPECPRCSVPMTYHSANGRLMCHYCGHSEPAYERCPQCGGIMKHIGTGTQKVEEELHALFPGAKVLRMDTDTVGASHGHEKLLRQFEEEKIPILLGTQMVAKGLDFENVTLVGVLCADASLYIDNYRAPERTFSLLSQVVGRAGRGSKQGRAIIQTFTPENEVIRAAAAQDYDAFYESEIRMRRLRRYPPFADLFSFTVTGADESRVIRAAKALRDALGYAVERREELKPLSIEVLGPAGASVVKVNNRYRYRVFLVGKGCPALRRLVAEYLYAFYQHKENRGLDIFADCNAIQEEELLWPFVRSEKKVTRAWRRSATR